MKKTNQTKLASLSLQFYICLDNSNLAEAIYLTKLAATTVSNKDTMIELCEVHYTADDCILEVDLSCVSSISDQTCYGYICQLYRMLRQWIPDAVDYSLLHNNRSIKYMHQIWDDKHNDNQPN